MTGTFCQADPTNVYTLGFIRDDGAEWISAGKRYEYCGMHHTAGWVFGPDAAYDGITRWGAGHRINGVFLIGRAPLTTPPHMTSIGGVQWSNVVARFDIALDWTVER